MNLLGILAPKQRDITSIWYDQLLPVLGPVDARLVSGVAVKIAEFLGDEMSHLEDFVTIPALATVLGYAIKHAEEAKARRTEMIDAGVDVIPSLFQGEQVMLAVMKAAMGDDPRPNHFPTIEYQRNKAILERAEFEGPAN